MCEKAKCQRQAADLCSCPPVRNRAENVLTLIEHLAVNMTDIRWELDYTDLSRPERRRLCRVGACRVCGGVLCHELDASDHLAGDDFLAAVYRHLYQLHHAKGKDMTDAEFRRRFVEMFHDQDRPLIRAWLERPENSHICRMYRRTPKGVEKPSQDVVIYTIVRTGTDADRGLFPDPQTEGSFLSRLKAHMELQKLIDAEKAGLDSRYDCEESGEDYWEAFQVGYAAALFTRLEIVQSDLRLTSFGTMPDIDSCGDGACACAISGTAHAERQRMADEESETLERILKMRRQ